MEVTFYASFYDLFPGTSAIQGTFNHGNFSYNINDFSGVSLMQPLVYVCSSPVNLYCYLALEALEFLSDGCSKSQPDRKPELIRAG